MKTEITLELNQIEAQGNLIMFYRSGLTYISNFQKFKRGDLKAREFAKNELGMFHAFLIEFKVVRSYQKSRTNDLLHFTEEWIRGGTPDDVDGFAKFLKENKDISHGVAISMASKILFLNNPWSIIPYDRLAKNALGYKKKEYAGYIEAARNAETINSKIYDARIKEIEPMLKKVESNFSDTLYDFETIRKKRYLDKLLWTIGKNKGKSKSKK